MGSWKIFAESTSRNLYHPCSSGDSWFDDLLKFSAYTLNGPVWRDAARLSQQSPLSRVMGFWVFLSGSPGSGKKKQHKHKLFGPDFPRTFLTLTPGCPGVKKFLPITGAAEKRTFWCGRPRFSARTSMTRRVVEKLCTKEVCVDFLVPTGEHAKWRCDPPPPPQRGYLSDTCAIPSESKAKHVRYPPLRYYFERVLRDPGGISHWAAELRLYQQIKDHPPPPIKTVHMA